MGAVFFYEFSLICNVFSVVPAFKPKDQYSGIRVRRHIIPDEVLELKVSMSIHWCCIQRSCFQCVYNKDNTVLSGGKKA
jgi:hypothetical protein